MSTLASNKLSGSSNFNPERASMMLAMESTYNNGAFSIALDTGVAVETTDLSKKSGGTTVDVYDMKRHNSLGNTGDYDRYAAAKKANYGFRQVVIDNLGDSVVVPLQGTYAQQASIFDLKQGVAAELTTWVKNIKNYALLSHLGGENTTTKSTIIYDSAISDSADLSRIRGFNSITAIDSSRIHFGSNAAGSISTDQAVTSANLLTFADVNKEIVRLGNTSSGAYSFQFIQNKPFKAVCFVSESGWDQLTIDSSGINFTNIFYNSLAGGKSGVAPALSGSALPNYIIREVLYVVVPDHFMPTGVNTSTQAAVANTRRAIICGAGAIDLAYGNGVTGADDMRGAVVGYDNTNKTLNKHATFSVDQLWGCKAVLRSGLGGSASTNYGNTSVITHYAY